MARKRKCSFLRALRGITKDRNLGINIAHKLLPKKLREKRKSKSDSKHRNGAENKSKPRISSGVDNTVPVFAWVN